MHGVSKLLREAKANVLLNIRLSFVITDDGNFKRVYPSRKIAIKTDRHVCGLVKRTYQHKDFNDPMNRNKTTLRIVVDTADPFLVPLK